MILKRSVEIAAGFSEKNENTTKLHCWVIANISTIIAVRGNHRNYKRQMWES